MHTFRFGIRKGADDPEMVPHGHDFDEDMRKRNVVEFFVMIGRLDLRPGEMFFNHDERPGFFWSFLLGVQVTLTSLKLSAMLVADVGVLQ